MNETVDPTSLIPRDFPGGPDSFHERCWKKQQCKQNIWSSAETAQAKSSFPPSSFLLWPNRASSSTPHWLVNCWKLRRHHLALPQWTLTEQCHFGSGRIRVNMANSPVSSHSIPLPVTLLCRAWSMRLDLQRNGIRCFVSQSAREEGQSGLSPPTFSTRRVERGAADCCFFPPLSAVFYLSMHLFFALSASIRRVVCLWSFWKEETN